MVWTFFDMDPKIEVLLENARSRDSQVILIVENDGLRAGYATSHAISSTDARERAISRFHGAPGVVVSRLPTCHNFSKSPPRGNLG